MASIVPMSFFTPDETINPNEYTFEIVDKKARDKDLWFDSCTILSTSGSSGTLATITDSRITGDYVITKFVPANSSYIISSVTCTTSSGQAVLTGISTAATTAEIMLTEKA